MLVFADCINFIMFQRMRNSTFPESRTSTFESLPGDLLRRCYVFYCRLRGFCARYMAFTTLHGDNDLCSSYRLTNTGRQCSKTANAINTERTQRYT